MYKRHLSFGLLALYNRFIKNESFFYLILTFRQFCSISKLKWRSFRQSVVENAWKVRQGTQKTERQDGRFAEEQGNNIGKRCENISRMGDADEFP